MHQVPRYVPERTLPAYAFIPGRTPHPRNAPDGHSHGAPEPIVQPLDEGHWQANTEYLWGVDLYNSGYPWEAHEAWEGLWRVAAPSSAERAALQGLIQCAAAVVKALAGQPAGVAKLGAGALDYLGRVVEGRGARYLGIELDRFTTAFSAYLDARPFAPEQWPRIELAIPQAAAFR